MQRYVILLTIIVIAAACSGDDGEAATTTAADTPTTGADVAVTEVITDGEVPQDGDSVEVHYVGTLDDGTQFDSSRDREPLVFQVGLNPPQVIAGFEDAVRGMAVGDVVTVRIPPEEAYGEVDEELILYVPIEQAPDDVAVLDEVLIGGEIPGVVTAISETEVTIDTNHLFAGHALTFEIELLSITG